MSRLSLLLFVLSVTPVGAAVYQDALTSKHSARLMRRQYKVLQRRSVENEKRPVERHETGAGPSIAIVSMCIDEPHDHWKAKVGGYGKYTMDNHRNYASRHGYEYLVRTSDASQNQGNSKSYPRLQKAAFLLEVMNQSKYDWIFWTDCDTLFMNFATKLEDFLPTHGDMVVSGDSTSAVNSGQFLFRGTSAWVREMLQFVNKGCINDMPCQCNHNYGQGFGDQVLFKYFIFGDCTSHSDPKASVTLLPVQSAKSQPTAASTLGQKAVCERLLQESNSRYKGDIACAEMATYEQEYKNATSTGGLFRLHFAGDQSVKLSLVRKYVPLVQL